MEVGQAAEEEVHQAMLEGSQVSLSKLGKYRLLVGIDSLFHSPRKTKEDIVRPLPTIRLFEVEQVLPEFPPRIVRPPSA